MAANYEEKVFFSRRGACYGGFGWSSGMLWGFLGFFWWLDLVE
jgi:hypothetical protein